MSIIKPFTALRPQAQLARQVASKPYDVLSSEEARREAQGNPYSFLHITKSEIDLPAGESAYSDAVYEKAKENLTAFLKRDVLFTESKPCYYIYRLHMPAIVSGNNDISQTGLVCVSSIDDYENNKIKKHELTRPDKEQDRINHIKITGAQTGNVFLAYRNVEDIDAIILKYTTAKSPVYDFVAEDGINHSIWVVNDNSIINEITLLFETKVPHTYIADGHHRAASAAKVRRLLSNPGTNANYFLTTLFPESQLQILDYNRVIKSLNGLTAEEFLEKLKEDFIIAEAQQQVRPTKAHEFGLYIKGKWYRLQVKEGKYTKDPIGVLDISILQQLVLSKHLNIHDQRTDKNIDFVGGIRGLNELENRVNSGEMEIAVSLYPVSIEQLFSIADSGKTMPPKSTWFEPKLRDGLFTHLIYE